MKQVRYCHAHRVMRKRGPALAVRSEPYEPGTVWHLLLEHGFVNHQYELIYDAHAPDMVLIGGVKDEKAWDILMQRAHELFEPKPLLISKCGECVRSEARYDGLDYIFSSRPDQGNNICFGPQSLPSVITSMQHNGMRQWAWPAKTPKSRFCNCIGRHQSSGSGRRVSFGRKLMHCTTSILIVREKP